MAPHNILIVDPNKRAALQYKNLLQELGLSNTHTAASRMETYEILKKFRRDTNQPPGGIENVFALAIVKENLKDHDDNPELF